MFSRSIKQEMVLQVNNILEHLDYYLPLRHPGIPKCFAPFRIHSILVKKNWGTNFFQQQFQVH